MERRSVNESGSSARRSGRSEENLTITLSPEELARVQAAVGELKEDIKPGDTKRASGAYAITVPPEEPYEESAEAQEQQKAEN